MVNKLIYKLNILKEQGIRINIPHKTVFGVLFCMLIILFAAVSFTTYYMAIVTIPVLAIWSYSFYWFSGVWRGFGYSVKLLIIFAVITVLLGIFIGIPIVQYAWRLIKTKFN